MTRLRQLSLPQRVVLVVGVGAALLVSWVWWYVGEVQRPTGWFAYAPNTATATDTYAVVATRQLEHLVAALVLVAGWTIGSVWLLGPTHRGSGETD